MDDVVKRLALKLKLRRTSGNVVHHAAILMKLLGSGAELAKGYCVIPETKEACEHYWVRYEGMNLDVAFELAKLRSPELQAVSPVLLECLPPGLTRSDATETMIREENERLYELYQRDSKAFWRDSPHDVRSFRLN